MKHFVQITENLVVVHPYFKNTSFFWTVITIEINIISDILMNSQPSSLKNILKQINKEKQRNNS